MPEQETLDAALRVGLGKRAAGEEGEVVRIRGGEISKGLAKTLRQAARSVLAALSQHVQVRSLLLFMTPT